MRKLVVAPLVALVLTVPALVSAVSVAGAAGAPNPCKVLKTSEISKAFGGADVSAGKPGVKTPVSVQCKYAVGATADLPEGDVIVHVMFVGGKPAYDGLKKTEGYVPTTGLANSIYNDKLNVVNTLDGGTLLGMQGLFNDGSLPVTYEDVQSQLVVLSRAGLKRM